MFKTLESICFGFRNCISCDLFCRCYVKINLKYMNFEIHVGEIRVVESYS